LSNVVLLNPFRERVQKGECSSLLNTPGGFKWCWTAVYFKGGIPLRNFEKPYAQREHLKKDPGKKRVNPPEHRKKGGG